MTTFTKANALFSMIGLFEEAQPARFPGNCWKMRLDCPEKPGTVGSLVISEGLWCTVDSPEVDSKGRGGHSQTCWYFQVSSAATVPRMTTFM